MAISVVQSQLATGDSTSNPINATLTGVVLRRWMLAFGSAYNPGTIGAAGFLDDQSSPSNSWSNVAEEQTGSDVFNLAFGATKVLNGGTVEGEFAPSAGRYPTYCLFEVNAPWNAQLNTAKIHEWVGTTLNFTFNAPPHATTQMGFVNGVGQTYPSTDWQAYLGMSWYDDTDPTAPLVAAGWTVIRKQTNFSGLTQTLAVLSMSGSGTSGPTVNVATGIGGGINGVAIGVILAAPPRVFGTSARTGGGATDVATDTLTFSTWQPKATDRIVVGTDAWRTGTGGIDTTASMLTDNDSGTYSALETIAAATGRVEAAGNTNTPGCGIYSRYLSADPGTDPFTITQDIDPGGALEGYWSWGAICISDTESTDPVAAVSAHDPPTWPEFQPHTLGGPVLTDLKAGRLGSITWTHTLVVYYMHNSFHESQVDIAAPSGCTEVLHNEENSAYLAGHFGFKFKLADTADETLSMAITELSGSVTYGRGIMVAIKLVEGSVVTPSGNLLLQQLQHAA